MQNKLIFIINLIMGTILLNPLNATDTLVPKTAFEIDGNKTNDGGFDWADGTTSLGTTPAPDNFPTTGVFYNNTTVDPENSGTDDVGTGGIKLDGGPVWSSGSGPKPPSKADLIATSIAVEQVIVSPGVYNDILYASFERSELGTGTGTMIAYIFVEDGDGILPSDGDTDGDWLFIFEKDPSDGSMTTQLFEKITGTYTAITIPDGAAEAKGDIQVGTGGNAVGGNFGEIAVNLTTLNITSGTGCSNASVLYSGTAASAATTAQIKDIVGIPTVKFCPRDFGDLPDTGAGTGVGNYETLRANTGPSHIILQGGPYLGSIVDLEFKGSPSINADGDDNDGSNDHDGVTFVANNTSGIQAGTLAANTAQFEVIAGTAGILNAWIDWNGDGDFDDTNERIATEQSLAVGTHTLTVPNIGASQVDDLYHRWRFTASTGQANTPNGEAPNGEVEDYYVDNSDLPLPVELTSFEVNATFQGVLCEWLTESEIENLGFILERKSGENWETVASYKTTSDLMGQGTTSAPTSYEYLDALVDANKTYTYRLADVDYEGVVTYHSVRTVKVDQAPLTSKIEEFSVMPAYPNPFNPTTTLAYGMDKDSRVEIAIYDVSGRLITTLLNTYQKQGWHSVVWNGTDYNNNQVPAGIYLSKITSNNTTKTIKLMLLK